MTALERRRRHLADLEAQDALMYALVHWGEAIRAQYRCTWGGALECGGECCLLDGHDGPHLCVGDDDGPGSCPA